MGLPKIPSSFGKDKKLPATGTAQGFSLAVPGFSFQQKTTSYGGVGGTILPDGTDSDGQPAVNPVTIMLKDDLSSVDLQIPVNPPEISIRRGRQYETVNILNLGEVDFTTGDKLAEVSFQSFFPVTYDPSLCGTTPKKPLEYYEQLKKWLSPIQIPPEVAMLKNIDREVAYLLYQTGQSEQKGPPLPPTAAIRDPIRLIITGGLDINMLVTLTNLEVTDRGGQPGDIYYSVTFRDWRYVRVRTVDETKQKKTQPRPDTKPVPKYHDCKTGDTLYGVARSYYGQGSRWPDVYNANMKELNNDYKTELAPPIKLLIP